MVLGHGDLRAAKRSLWCYSLKLLLYTSAPYTVGARLGSACGRDRLRRLVYLLGCFEE